MTKHGWEFCRLTLPSSTRLGTHRWCYTEQRSCMSPEAIGKKQHWLFCLGNGKIQLLFGSVPKFRFGGELPLPAVPIGSPFCGRTDLLTEKECWRWKSGAAGKHSLHLDLASGAREPFSVDLVSEQGTPFPLFPVVLHCTVIQSSPSRCLFLVPLFTLWLVAHPDTPTYHLLLPFLQLHHLLAALLQIPAGPNHTRWI